MILDVFVIIIVIIAAVMGYKYGAAGTIVSLVGSVLCYCIAAFIGDAIAPVIYNGYISDAVISNVSEYITTTKSNISVDAVVDSLPSFVRVIVDSTSYSTNPAFIDAVVSTQSTAQAVEAAVSPLIISVISFLFAIVFFVILYLIFKLFIKKPIMSVFRLPFVKSVDSIVGILCSILSSLVLISFLAFLLKLLNPVVDNMPAIFSQSTIYNSYIFYYFYNGNIFSAITSIF